MSLETQSTAVKVYDAHSGHVKVSGAPPVNIKPKHLIKPVFPLQSQQTKTHITSFCLNEEEQTMALTSSHGLIYWYMFVNTYSEDKTKPFKIVCSCEQGTQLDVWYTPKHKLWWTSGRDNLLHGWKVSKRNFRAHRSLICQKCRTMLNLAIDKSKGVNPTAITDIEKAYDDTERNMIKFSLSHEQKVMDVIEITRPTLAIITASLDGKLRNIQDFNTMWVVDRKSPQRQLDFSRSHGGALLAVGFTQKFTVWDISDNNSYIHDRSVTKTYDTDSMLVLNARFMTTSFFVVSVDSLGTVRVWNYKLKRQIQVIVTNYSGDPKIQGLLVFSPTRFCVYGRRIQFYSTADSEKQAEVQKSALRSISSQAMIEWRSRFFSNAIDCIFCELL